MESIAKTPKDRGERVVVEVESFSRPGLTYKVVLPEGFCPCDGHYYRGTCSHVDEARVRTAPYRVEERHDSRFGVEYAVAEYEGERFVRDHGFRCSYYDALRDCIDLSGAGRAF